MLYDDYLNSLVFPSGRSVKNCKKDASRDKKFPLSRTQLLDDLAKKNFGNYEISWKGAIKKLKEESIAKINESPAEITPDELKKIAKRHRRLTQYGVGLPKVVAQLHQPVMQPNTPCSEEFYKDYEEIQNAMLFDYDSIAQINMAIRFIRCLKPSLNLNKRNNRHSHAMKHVAEHYLSIERPYTYISHGIFIIAAIHQGYLPEVSKNIGIGKSVFFNFDEASILEVESVCQKHYSKR